MQRIDKHISIININMISDICFDKNEYLNNNPEQGIAIAQSVRDTKSHSKIYLKQAEARNQRLAETINQLSNKNQMTIRVIDSVQPVKPVKPVKPRTKKYSVRASQDWDLDYSEEYLTDVIEEMADEEATKMMELQEKQLEEDKEYRLLMERWQAEEEIAHETVSTQICDDVESVDEDVFNMHYHNLMALEKYYANLTPENKDDEYEFWLTFEIRAFEEGSRDITEVFRSEPEFDDEQYMKDADDLMQEEIERRTEDALDDRDY